MMCSERLQDLQQIIVSLYETRGALFASLSTGQCSQDMLCAVRKELEKSIRALDAACVVMAKREENHGMIILMNGCFSWTLDRIYRFSDYATSSTTNTTTTTTGR